MDYKNKEWLQQQYIDKNLSTIDIANLCGVSSHQTILNWLKKFNIKTRNIKESANENVKNKRKQTWFKKYGCENPLQNKDIQEKQRKTNLKRYEVENVFQNKEIQKKQKRTNIENGNWKLINGKTLSEWSKNKDLASQSVICLAYKNGVMPWETKSYKSTLEIKVKKLLDSFGIIYQNNKVLPEHKGLKKGSKRPDFLLPDSNLIIECDGEIWHLNKEKDLERNNLYENFGYDVLCFTGQEIENNWNKVEETILQIIRSKINIEGTC